MFVYFHRDVTGAWLAVGTGRGLHLYQVDAGGAARAVASTQLRFTPKVANLPYK